jgi:tetratricopeptide (TPR) repeat protein
MSANFLPNHLPMMIECIKRGDAIAILGAGVNRNATDQFGDAILDGQALARLLAEKLGYPYEGESLSEVVSAYKHQAGTQPFNRQLERSFKNCRPSDDLRKLTNYAFRRIYTWNVDDALEKCSIKSNQKKRIFNGMLDKVEESPGIETLQIINLHGSINNPDAGFIFSEQDYSRVLTSGTHHWYKKLAEDYRSYCPIFIGSKLNEPILSAELEKITREQEGNNGLSFLVSPDNLSPIKLASLEARGIRHVKMTFEDFILLLEREIGPNLTSSEITINNAQFPIGEDSRFTRKEISAAQFLRPINARTIQREIAAWPADRHRILARKFLQGFEPTWPVCASNIPVRLSGSSGLADHIIKTIEKRIPLHITVGPAGSGKSTAVMQALLKIAETEKFDVFELDINFESIIDAISLLSKISSKKKIIYIPFLYVASNIISQEARRAEREGIYFVSTARSSEWGSHLSLLMDEICETYSIDRFGAADFDPLIARLIEYVPAPRFNQMSPAERRRKFQNSKSQLLIAMREATESKNFDEIIADEMERIKDEEIRNAFILIGLSTLARVGVSEGMVIEALGQPNSVKWNGILRSLEGIVGYNSAGRLFGRHDFYVRKAFEMGITGEEIVSGLRKLLKAFTKYKNPIARNVHRNDAALFRYLLNHDSLKDLGKLWGNHLIGSEIYQYFEVDFQLDGHFWLQYGLFHGDLGDTTEALEKLDKSIQAFPGNLFAQHALASVKLRHAAERKLYDKTTVDLIDDAVLMLRELEANPSLKSDAFPIVTLAIRHIGALRAHGRSAQAKKAAETYLAEIQRTEKRKGTRALEDTKHFLLKYIALDAWEPPTTFSKSEGLGF